ncbi:MAG: gephyrin-like molybdotransferase Glp [Acidobacteriota bacterium]
MPSPHSPEDAWALLEPWLDALPPEAMARQAALDRVLAVSPRARVDVPPCDVSAMDGYALTGDLPRNTPLPVVATLAAGEAPGLTLGPGQVARIMTGAAIPHGADRVVPVELTDAGVESVTLLHPVELGAHIRRQGEIQRTGENLLPVGATLSPGALALLATHGYARVEVRREPRVAVLATGDEVVPPESTPRPGQVRNSHGDFLLAAGRGLGLRFADLGIARDDRLSLRAEIQRGLGSEVLLISGGVSMGAYDLVEGVLAELGAKVVFDGVAMQPGKPIVVFRHAGGLVFGLPGNPASAMVAYWLFVRPALRRLMGHRDRLWSGALRGRLVEDLQAAPERRDRFLPAAAWAVDGEIRIRPFPPRGSHDVATFARGNALLRLRAGAPALAAGEPAEILPLAAISLEPS